MASKSGRVVRAVSFDSDQQAAAFDEIAQKMGLKRSDLAKAIAKKEYIPLQINEETQLALVAALTALQNMDSSQASALQALLEEMPLSQPLKAQLRKTEGRDAAWVQKAERLIAAKKPFTLSYHGKQQQIRYAEVVRRDDREYLHCWVEEPNPKPDLKALAHNRLFSVNESAQLEATGGQWRDSGLDSIEVVFSVAFAYKPKAEDLQVESTSVDGQQWTRITQRVTNLLWLLQRVSRYADRCVIESPGKVRALYVEKLAWARHLNS